MSRAPNYTADICRYLIASTLVSKGREESDRRYLDAALLLRHHGDPTQAVHVIRDETEELTTGTSKLPQENQYAALSLLQTYLSFLTEMQSKRAADDAAQRPKSTKRR